MHHFGVSQQATAENTLWKELILKNHDLILYTSIYNVSLLF